MTAYCVLNYRVTDPEAYQAYLRQAGQTLRPYGVETLVADYASEPVEGEPAPVTVVLRFDSKETARRWYESPEYQAVLRHRLDNTEGFAVFCDEFVRPS
jgi:uncharacterized protein (DUF1330 family)